MEHQCCRSGINIPDPNFSIPDPGSRVKKIPFADSHQKILSIFNPNFFSQISRKYDLGCHPESESRMRILIFYPFRIPVPGVKKAPDPVSATLSVDHINIR